MAREIKPAQIKFSFDKETLKKIGKGALIALGSAALTALAEYLSGIDFGEYTVAVMAVVGIVINGVREYFKGA